MAKPIVITLLGDGSDLERSLSQTGNDVSELGRRLAAALQDATGEAAQMGDAVAEGVKKAEKETSGFGSKIKGAALLAGAGVAAGLTAGIMEAMDREAGNDLLAAQVGATPEQAKTLGRAAGEIFSSGLGDSMGEVNDGLKALWQQGLVPAGATADEISEIGSKLMNVSKIMGEDLGPTANAAGQMVKTGLVDTFDDGMDLLVRGTQLGINKSEDLLDTFNEYGTQFRKIVLDGPKALGLMNQALQAGARDSDVAADALKEFTLNSIDLGKSADAYEKLGLNGDKMVKALSGGGPRAAQATQQIFDAMHKLKDPVDLNTVSLGLFGTKAEDLGAALNAMDPSTAVKSLGDFKGAADEAGKTLNDNAATKVKAFSRTIQTHIVDFIGAKVIPGLESIGRKFAPVAEAVKTALTGTVIPMLKSLGQKFAPIAQAAKEAFVGVIIPALVKLVGYVGPVVGALADVAKWMWNNRAPILIVAGVITAVLLPALIAWGVQATTAALANATAWVTSTATATASAATQVLAHWSVVGGWLKAAGQAVISAAIVVAGWVAMGAQALIQAARMAAAWLIAMGPVGLIIAAVAGLAALIWANWDKIKTWTLEAFDWVWNKILSVFNWLKDLFLNFSGASLIIKHWDTIKEKTSEAFQWVWDKITGVFEWLKNLFLNFTGPGLIIKHWDKIKEATANAFGFVRDKAKAGLDAVVDFVRSLPGRILSAAASLLNAGKSLGAKVIDGIKSGLSKLGGFATSLALAISRAAKGAINSVIDLMNWAIPDKLGWGKFSIDLPKNPIPHVRAMGGPVSGLTRVGERGPEWVNLPTGSTVIPNHAAPNSGGVVVNVQTNADPWAIGREVAWALRTAPR
ncbi:phage tail tape measure protein [Streptomyces sp. x-80]|uniref:phage tail tape measure protein n=1 Tax=Streptomyces sp. x-80 TaxID=2789282 RepID=UPI00397F119E